LSGVAGSSSSYSRYLPFLLSFSASSNRGQLSRPSPSSLACRVSLPRSLYPLQRISRHRIDVPLVSYGRLAPSVYLLLTNASGDEAISICVSGLLLGQVVGRSVSGCVGNQASFRVVYWFGFAIQAASLLTIYAVLPDWPAKETNLNYRQILFSMAKLLVTKPTVIQTGLVGLISSACQVISSFILCPRCPSLT
jgi:hypothetical protein